MPASSDLHSEFRFEDWLRQGGDRSLKRFAVNASYSRIGWVYAAVNVIGKTIGGVPLEFFMDGEDGEENRIEDPTAPILQLFEPPNPPAIPSIRELLFRTFVHLGIQGGLYWAVSKSDPRLETPDIITTKKLGQIRPIFADGGEREQIGWVEQDKNMRAVAAFRLNEVVPIFLYNPQDERFPLSPLSAARLSLESEFNMNAWNAAFFRQGLRSPLAIKLRQRLSPTQEKELDKRIKKFYGGIDQAQAAIILHGGMEPVDLPLTTKDIEFIEGKKLNREEILGIYGVPPAMVGIFEFANYANSREQRKIFWQNTLLPSMAYILDLLNLNLLAEHFPGVVARFDLSGVEVLQPDPTEIATSAKIYNDMGYNRDEIANILNAPKLAERIEATADDDAPPEEEEPEEEPTEPTEDEDVPTVTPDQVNDAWVEGKQPVPGEAWWLRYGRAHEALILREEERTLGALRQFQAAIEKGFINKLRRGEPLILSDMVWGDIWRGAIDLHVARTMTLAAQVTVLELGRPLKSFPDRFVAKAVDLGNYFDPAEEAAFRTSIDAFTNRITNVGTDLVNELNGKLQEQLVAGQTIDQIRRTIGEVVDETFQSRALTIARTTSNAAYNTARFNVMAMKGVTSHRWVNAGDNAVRESHMLEGGNVVDLGQPFPVTTLTHPLQVGGPPAEVINCRCTTVAVLKIDRSRQSITGQDPIPQTDEDTLGGLLTASLQDAMTDIFQGSVGGKTIPFKTPGVLPVRTAVDQAAWGAKVLGDEKVWDKISEALDLIPDRAPKDVLASVRTIRAGSLAAKNAPKLTTAGTARLTRLMQRSLPASIREGLEAVDIKADGKATAAFYNSAVGRSKAKLTIPRHKMERVIEFMNDPQEYLANGGSFRQALDGLEDVVHEYGHHIQETNAATAGWARATFHSRTTNLGESTLVTVGGKGARGLEDKWYAKYQGRVYPWELPTRDVNFAKGTEVTSVYYEKAALLPWDKWWRDIISQSSRHEDWWSRSLSELFLVDPDGAREMFKLWHGEF